MDLQFFLQELEVFLKDRGIVGISLIAVQSNKAPFVAYMAEDTLPNVHAFMIDASEALTIFLEKARNEPNGAIKTIEVQRIKPETND